MGKGMKRLRMRIPAASGVLLLVDDVNSWSESAGAGCFASQPMWALHGSIWAWRSSLDELRSAEQAEVSLTVLFSACARVEFHDWKKRNIPRFPNDQPRIPYSRWGKPEKRELGCVE